MRKRFEIGDNLAIVLLMLLLALLVLVGPGCNWPTKPLIEVPPQDIHIDVRAGCDSTEVAP
jgi:hypothetical protein